MAGRRRRQHNRALFDAVLRDDAVSVQNLPQSGADVNARDPEHGETPLMLARSSVMLRLLLDAGANVHARDSRGRTPFHCCPDALLLAAGADINAQDNDGETPLMHAVLSVNFDLAPCAMPMAQVPPCAMPMATRPCPYRAGMGLQA